MNTKIAEILKEKGADAALLSTAANIRYISGFAGTDSYLYVTPKRRVILTDSRYTLRAKEEGKGCEIRTMDREHSYGALLGELLREDQAERIGFEEQGMLYGTLDNLWKKSGFGAKHWVMLGDGFSKLRVIKKEEELVCLEKAEQIGDAAFRYILGELKPGMTELEVAAKLEYYMRSHGAEGTSFDTIVASGLHSAMPHAVPTEKKLESGDFVTMDFGCKYHGYCSDMTRTVVIGKASARQKEVYQVVLEAQSAALKGLRPGMTCKEGDTLARDVIQKAGYGAYFGHSLGHSVGLEIHERPALSPGDEHILRPGMIETVEPGIYIPDFGGVRIEDMVVITVDGIRNLTASPKELIEI